MKHKYKPNFLTSSFIIFLSFITLFFCAGYYLFNSITIKDLKIGNTVFASTGITFEKLGFSDMTLAEFLNTMQSFISPDEYRILNNAPGKKDRDALLKDLQSLGLEQENIPLILSETERYKTKDGIMLTDREICLLLNGVLKNCGLAEYNNITALCGEDSVSVENVYLRYDEKNKGRLLIDIVACVDITTISDKILQNFGQPLYQICDRLYFTASYEVILNNGEINLLPLSVIVNNMEKEFSDKMMGAIYTAYNLTDFQGAFLFSYENLCWEIKSLFNTVINNLGNYSDFAVFNREENLTERTDMKEKEIYIIQR